MSVEPAMKKDNRGKDDKPLIKGIPANLDELPVGSSCVLLAITGERRLRRRLMEMGLLEGSRLRVVKFAPTGDPIQIQVNDYFLSLRKREAARIIVDPDGPSSVPDAQY